MEKPRSAAGRSTEIENVEIIRKMAPRHDDGEIAGVLNKLSRRTGQGLSWGQSRVANVRRKNGVAAPLAGAGRDEILSLNQAAAYRGVRDTTIRRLVESKLLLVSQVAPWAPWEIQRADLDREPVLGILTSLRKTGKLVLTDRGTVSHNQPELFSKNQ
jgi:hypothetical protein